MAVNLWLLVPLSAVALGLVAAVRLRRRVRSVVHRSPMLADQDVERIIRQGIFVSDEDEPLDLEHVDQEERRFWEEAEWDEAEEW